MPAKSKAQQRLMAAAEHGADFPKAKAIRKSMTHEEMHDFAAGSMKDKPAHVKHGKGRDMESHAYNFRQRAGLKRGK